MPRNLRLSIAFLQVAGGLFGILVILSTPVHVTGLAALFLLFLLAAMALTCVAGVLLWRGHPWGDTLSVVAQALQLPVLYGSGFTYYYHAGLGVSIAIGPQVGIHFDLHLGTAYSMAAMGREDAPAIGINLIAALALYFLLKYANEPSEQPAVIQGSA